MAKALDLSGQRFGRLVAETWTGMSKHGCRVWTCRCDCGGTIDVPLLQLRSAQGSTGTRSCGCLARESQERCLTPTKIAPRHGMYRSLTYKRWISMKARCSNTSADNFPRYGGRGIRVCERWDAFESFFADMGECPHGYSLERDDVNGNYDKKNCRWIPLKEQYNNKRTSRKLFVDGAERTMAEWCRHFGIRRNTVEDRLRRGWGVDRSLKTPSLRAPLR